MDAEEKAAPIHLHMDDINRDLAEPLGPRFAAFKGHEAPFESVARCRTLSELEVMGEPHVLNLMVAILQKKSISINADIAEHSVFIEQPKWLKTTTP